MIKISAEKINKMLFIFFTGITFVFPLSNNGNTLPSLILILVWVALFLGLLVMILINKINLSRLLMSLCALIYLFLATLVILSDDFLISFSRIMPFLCILVVFVTDFTGIQDKRFILKVFDIICIYIIIVNIFSLCKVTSVNEILSNFYTQSEKYITDYQLQIGKPVAFFGVHNIASFIYTGLFILSLELYYKYSEKKYIMFFMVFFILNVLLRSTTSFCFAMLMLLLLLKRNKKLIRPVIFILMIMCIYLISSFPELIEGYINNFFNGSNGFIPRYIESDNGLYNANFEVLNQYVLGIGFTIANDSLGLFYADSGYIIFYTMGGYILPIMIYLLFFKFVKKNIKSSYLKGVVIFYVVLTEFGMISFMYLKSITFYLFIMMIIKSVLDEKNNMYNR